MPKTRDLRKPLARPPIIKEPADIKTARSTIAQPRDGKKAWPKTWRLRRSLVTFCASRIHVSPHHHGKQCMTHSCRMLLLTICPLPLRASLACRPCRVSIALDCRLKLIELNSRYSYRWFSRICKPATQGILFCYVKAPNPILDSKGKHTMLSELLDLRTSDPPLRETKPYLCQT